MDITKIPIIQITNGTEVIEINPQSDVGIASGTLKLDKIIVNSELKFGELYSDKFEVEIYNIEDDLSGCPIQLFIEENNVRTVKFTGVIESSKRDRIGYSRKIIAYDWVHYHRDDDISTWWNNFWTTSRLSATIKEIRDSLISYMGFTGDSNTYVNDSITIPNNFNPYTDLKFHTIISMLCELQGTLPHIAEDGSFKFITINNTTEDITGDYEGNNCNWEDYTTNAITGIGIYSTSDDLSQLIGTNANVYRVAGNLFALTLNASDLTTLGTNLLSAISTIQFVPNTIKMKITNFDLALGQRYNTEHGYGYVMSNAISGVCMVEQTLKSVAMGENLSETVSTRNDTMIEGAKMSKFEQTIDGFQTEVSQATQTANTALTRANGSITTDTLHYLATPLSSGVTTQTAGWTTTPQSMTPTNKYLWTYHTYTYADAHTSDTTPVITGVYGEDGQQGQTGPQGPAGQDGTSVTITSQSVTYQEGTSGTTAPSGTWSTTVPTVANGNYLWTKTVVNYSNNTSTTSYSVARQGQNGQNGTNGTSVTVSSIQYASSASGTTAPSSGWQNTIPTVAQGSYLWTKTTYSNGSVAYTNSRQGVNGTNGTNGTNGISITSVTSLYYASNSNTAPTAPTSEVTTTSTSVYNTWTKGVPALTSTYNKLYTCDQVKYSNNTFTWTTPVLQNAITTAVSEINQLADQIVLKVDNNGNIVKVALDASASTGTTFKVSADNISFIANGVIDLTADALAVKTTNFNMDQNGNITLNNGGILYIDAGNGMNATGIMVSGGGTSVNYTEMSINGFVAHNGFHVDQEIYECVIDCTPVLNSYGNPTGSYHSTLVLSYYDTHLIPDEGEEEVDNYNSLTLTETGIELKIGDINYPSTQRTLFSVSSTGQIKSNSLTASKILVSDANKNIVSSSLAVSDLITTSNIGLQSVNYATSAGSVSRVTFGNSGNGEHNANNISSNGLWYYTSNGPATSLGASTNDGGLYSQAYNTSWVGQIAQDYRNGSLFVRGKNNGTWTAWKRILDSTNGVSTYADNTFYKVAALLTFKGSNNALVNGDKGNYIWAISSWSDSRLKKNIKDSEVNALDIINNIKMREFDFKDEKYGHHEDIGYVAHELREIVPECVVDIPISEEEQKEYKTDTLMQVEDKHLIKYLVKAIQELSNEVERLKNGGN